MYVYFIISRDLAGQETFHNDSSVFYKGIDVSGTWWNIYYFEVICMHFSSRELCWFLILLIESHLLILTTGLSKQIR